jgi:hypothetical protein
MKNSEQEEKITLKGSNPDESRKRSIYFLLLVVGRQIASTSSLTDRARINGILKILEIEEDQDTWILKNKENKNILLEVPKSNFKFYQIKQDSSIFSKEVICFNCL